MTHGDRRSALAAIGSVMALAGLGQPLRAATRTSPVRFPDEPVQLQRVLMRSLGAESSITVSRTWECRFASTAEGARIEARQIAVDVQAPAGLAALAQLERKREVTGLFPMTLDATGMMTGWAGGTADLQTAVAAARRIIESRELDGPSMQHASRYVADMGRIAADLVSQVPRDLFFPEPGEKRQERALDLPGGGKGHYELIISARACAQSGLLERSDRRIVTRIGDSLRTSSERWSIA